MPSLPRLALALALLATSIGACAQSPRERVDGVADTIQAHYFDARRGTQIATDLRAAAARGEFDALTDPRDLATTLTSRLQPADRHFKVSITNAQAPPAAGPTRRSPLGVDDSARRNNYGIRRVEVQPGNVGYLDLREFAGFPFGEPDAPARRAIEAALQLLAGTDAVVIDLRDNGGGAPAMVGYLSSAFTPRGADIYNTFHSRTGTRTEAPADWYPQPRLDVPLYVLISGRTGSAAEAFAYTMKNAGRATVIGETSAGAANPGGEIDAGNGMRVFVSQGSPVNPISHDNWEGRGVAPDVAVAQADAALAARRLALERIVAADAGNIDARWALEALRAQSAPTAVAVQGYVGEYGAIRLSARDGQLLLQRDRRPPWTLLPLGGDLFTVVDEPGRRIAFERDASGRATALEIRYANGQSMRYRR